jgi:hypothetical protein
MPAWRTSDDDGRGGRVSPQALETHVFGCHFRSRLEARWATFFTELGIEWQYEPEVFDLPSGRYLPDFWLPRLSVYVEVRGDPRRCSSSEFGAHAIEMESRILVLTAVPEPPPVDFDWYWPVFSDHGDGWGVEWYGFGRVVAKGKLWQEWPPQETPPVPVLINDWSDARVIKAYTLARCARFDTNRPPVSRTPAERLLEPTPKVELAIVAPAQPNPDPIVGRAVLGGRVRRTPDPTTGRAILGGRARRQVP